MRISFTRERSLYSAFADRALHKKQQDVAHLQEKLNTGLQINRPSDDPAGYTQARQMEVLSERYTQYGRSIDSARGWLVQSEQALSGLSELFAQAHELGVRAANGTYSADQRGVMANQLEDLLRETLDTLNSKSGKEHLFAGSATAAPPFTRDPGTGVVTYNGDDRARERYLAPDLKLAISLTGDEVQTTKEGVQVTGALQALIDAVRTDPTQMKGALGQMEKARNHLVDLTANLGSLGNRLTTTETQLQDARLMAEAHRSNLEDTDYAQAMMDYQRQQMGVQAALKVSSSVLQTSLLDYLR